MNFNRQRTLFRLIGAGLIGAFVVLISCGKFSPTVPASKGQPQAPTAVTGAPTGTTPNSATVSGSVSPRGASTAYWFQWGATTAYGNQTAQSNLPGDYATHNVTANLTGLSAGTTYHYRVCAQNAQGTVCGNDMTFTTGATYQAILEGVGAVGDSSGQGAQVSGLPVSGPEIPVQ
jgi:phosphodiesterase/alkaline phosphatase D-like protein